MVTKFFISFDVCGKIHNNHEQQAVTMGPIVLADDSRFNDGFVDETAVIQAKDGIINLTPLQEKPPHIWMAFTIPCIAETDLEGTSKLPKSIKFCDFASVGNTWDSSNRYRVWLRNTLNVMNRIYEGY